MPPPGAIAGVIEGRGPEFPPAPVGTGHRTASWSPGMGIGDRPLAGRPAASANNRTNEVTMLLELADAYTASALVGPAPESARR